MAAKKTYEEALQEARIKMKKNRNKKTRAKTAEGYKYYAISDQPHSYAHRAYFRHLKSAKAWVIKHPYLGKEVFDLNEKVVWKMGGII